MIIERRGIDGSEEEYSIYVNALKDSIISVNHSFLLRRNDFECYS
jgi:hypothetical protein